MFKLIFVIVMVQLFFFNVGFYSMFLNSSNSLCDKENILTKIAPLHEAGCFVAKSVLTKQ